jgi:hypothetical protein
MCGINFLPMGSASVPPGWVVMLSQTIDHVSTPQVTELAWGFYTVRCTKMYVGQRFSTFFRLGATFSLFSTRGPFVETPLQFIIKYISQLNRPFQGQLCVNEP